MFFLTEAALDFMAKKLANFDLPEFDRDDFERSFDVLYPIFQNLCIDEDLFAQFVKKVSDHSNGQVILQNVDSSEFGFRIKGVALYLKLVSDNRVQKLTVGPYYPPIEFIA